MTIEADIGTNDSFSQLLTDSITYKSKVEDLLKGMTELKLGLHLVRTVSNQIAQRRKILMISSDTF